MGRAYPEIAEALCFPHVVCWLLRLMEGHTGYVDAASIDKRRSDGVWLDR